MITDNFVVHKFTLLLLRVVTQYYQQRDQGITDMVTNTGILNEKYKG